MAYKAEKKLIGVLNVRLAYLMKMLQGGVCERCGFLTTKKLKNQWMLKMSSYADSLIEGLKDTDFAEKIKTAQINWIGKSIGTEVNFKFKELEEELKVFTTRCDTLFGVTFVVMSPEHQLLKKYSDKIKNIDELKEYQRISALKNEIERTDASKEKTVDTSIQVGVQVIGKLRGTITVTDDDSEDMIREKALNEDNVKKNIIDKEIVKIIGVPKRIVSIVVR